MSSSSSTTSSAASRMQRWFPGTAYPLVVSAPMDFVTNPKLVTEVVKAKGFGFIQGGRTFTPDSPVLSQLEAQLSSARQLLADGHDNKNVDEKGTLPLGVGFVLYSACAKSHFKDTIIPILAKHRPAAVWLFAPDPKLEKTLDYVIQALRATPSATDSSWSPKIVVQVGTVSAAREAAELSADIIVAQGVDAGGHQFAKGAGIVSLVPEIQDMLLHEFPDKDIAVWAAGGLADGRGVAAALALGAEAAVLGTRYMVAVEADTQDFKRKAVLSASDGGLNTVKSQLHDHIQGNFEWPNLYDGRAIVHPSYIDHEAGLPHADNELRFREAKETGDTSRTVTWSGTGVGLVRSELPAAEITKAVRDEASHIIKKLATG
ncbi:FMN-dependent 2-nitropropane dioxygenase [Xylariaceae sp. FL0255]|nr:FMN-dependent 2-nitropropane dioxygenase [Xylariaceae sp. FL0255]